MNIIHRLRRKFILMALLAVVIILAGALGLINTITYMKMRGEVMTLMNVIAENDGIMPITQLPNTTESWLSDPEWFNDTPEVAHQVRYFSVYIDSEGRLRQLNLSNISAFTQNEALDIVRQVSEASESQGMFKKRRASYAYLVSPRSNGKLVVVMDITRDVGAVDSFMRYSIRFGLVCVLLYIIVLTALCNYAIRPFVENMENQKRFITNAGHELKTPIAIISANTEAMELLNGKSEWTNNILTQVKRVTRLINDLIILAKLGEKEQTKLQLKQVDISKLFREAVQDFSPLVGVEKKHLVLNIPEGITAWTEEKYMYEVFTLLMDNAVKYCDDGGTITATLSHGRKGFKATVTNNYAAGVNVDYSHFFERFYRGDESHNSRKDGYGIGLSMAMEVMNLLKGDLKVEYKDGVIGFTVEA